MQWLANVCVRRPVFTAVLMLLILVLGAAGYQKLGLDEFPNVDFPFVTITTKLPGAAPEEVETDVTDKIEGAVNTISGIDELRSISSEGVSVVIVQFTLDKDSDVAAQEVRDKINTVLQDLPKGIEQPIVGKIDPDSAPVLLLAIRSDKPIREMSEIADDEVRRKIETIDGVGQVTLIGARKRQVYVYLDPVALRSKGITAADVQRTLATQNMSVPGGSLENGPEKVTVRIAGRVTEADDVGRLIIRERDGHPIRVQDVAKVVDGIEEEKSYAQLDVNGEQKEGDGRTVVLAVRKQSGKNTVSVVDAVKSRLDEIRRALPEGTTIEVVRDNSQVVRTGIHAVEEHLVLGALLAGLVVLVFLGSLRSTLIAAVAIPISVVGTFAVMWAAGFTLNGLTLLALALAVGIVIDDAIVVLENIVRWIEVKKTKPFPAAILATREIGLAVLATTLSLMAVFLPVAAMPGMPGRFMMSFGLTMSFAIAVSMLVSFTLTPMLAARWLGAGAHDREGPLARLVDAFYRPIERVYMSMLRFVMRHRWIVILASVGSIMMLGPIMKRVPGGFLPQDDRGQFEISLRLPEGTSVEATRLLTERVATDVRGYGGDVTMTLLTVGEGTQEAANVGKVYVMLTDPKTRARTQFELMDQVRKEVLAKLPPEIRATVGEVQAISAGAGTQANVQIAIQGPDLDALGEHANRITSELKKVPGAVDVDNSLIVGKPELRVTIDRDRAASLGVNVADVADTLRMFVGGAKATTFADPSRTGADEVEIWVRADAQYRADADTLSLLNVPSTKVGSVPLLSVVQTHSSTGPAQIDRLGRRRQITISANAAPGVGDSTVMTALNEIVAKEQLPDGYSTSLVGRAKEQAKMGKGFLLVFALAFVFMYLVLAAQFESWLHPVTILLSLPLTVPFAMLSLLLFGQSINLFSGLGLLVLFGVVKKNAILQIDHTNHLRKLGMPRLEAILDANRDRLRPILMTTLAFVAGMIPLVLSRGIGSAQHRATGAIVLGGQSLSLLLTLLAVPVAYSMFDDVSQWVARVFARKTPRDDGRDDLDRLEEINAQAEEIPHQAPAAAE